MKLEEIFENMFKPSLVGSDGDVISIGDAYIDIKFKNTEHAPRKFSVIDFNVPKDLRNTGIGSKLISLALEKYPDLGAQVSSLASLKAFFKNGFRNPNIPQGSFEDHINLYNENWHSLFVAKLDENGKPYAN